MKAQPRSCIGFLTVLMLSILFAVGAVIVSHAYSATFGTGEYILFERYSNTYRMNLDGSAVQVIVKNAQRPVCSATGDGIVFTRFVGGNPNGRDLFWTDPGGSSVRRLTHGFIVPGPYTVSSHGIVAFVAGLTGKQELYTVRISDGTSIKHTYGSTAVSVFEWSPDGKVLGFAVNEGTEFDRNWQYYALDYTSGAIKKLTRSEYIYPWLSWSPSGSSVALVQVRAIEIIDMTTGLSRRLPREWGILGNIAWSPDGEYLAVSRGDEECHPFSGNIYVIRVSDNTETKVSKHWFRCRSYHSPRWSPDGTKVIFLAYRSRGDMNWLSPFNDIRDNIYIVNRDGSGQTNLSTNADV